MFIIAGVAGEITKVPDLEGKMKNVSKQQSYRPPDRGRIKAAVSALLPDVDPKIIQSQDWWRLYSIHQDIVKDGKSLRSVARKYLEGWEPGTKRPGAR